LFGGTALASPLALSFITTSTLDSWNVPISFFGFVTIPAQYLPYFLLFITLVCVGAPGALIQGTGLVAAHAYDFLTGLYSAYGGPSRNLLPTPEFLRKVLGTRVEVVRPYGTVLNANASSGSASAGVGASAWRVGLGKWGNGQRLGGDAEAGGPMPRGRSHLVNVLVVIGCVVVACGLGVVFMIHRDPERWWTTLKEAFFGGDISSATVASKGLSSSRG
jgi:Derlin-2/3